MKKKAIIAIAALTIVSQPSLAYEVGYDFIDIDNPNFDNTSFNFQRNHERLTALALKCLHDSNTDNINLQNKPAKCTDYLPIKKNFAIYESNGLKDDDALKDYLDLVHYVRWSDDPTRMLTSKKSIIKFGVLMGIAEDKDVKKYGIKSCKQRAKEGEFDLVHQGLLCNSHFGKLQFLHAMAETDGELSSLTHKKMMQWVNFSFEMIKTPTPKLGDTTGRNSNYCNFWRDASNYPDLVPVMNPDSADKAGWCNKAIPWTVATPLNLTCDGAALSINCTVFKNNADRTVKTAIGSIIHMIQDSYSNAHASRGDDHVEAKVMCDSIVSFRSYFKQDSERHGITDKWPNFDENCYHDKVTDPVTATAQVIWFAHNVKAKDSDKKQLDTQLNELMIKVFGNVPNPDIEASAGDQYKL